METTRNSSGTDRLFALLRSTWGDGEEFALRGIVGTYQTELAEFFPRRAANLDSAVRTALQTLLKRGSVKRVRRGVYALVGEKNGD